MIRRLGSARAPAAKRSRISAADAMNRQSGLFGIDACLFMILAALGPILVRGWLWLL
jgi:hypothetical protein